MRITSLLEGMCGVFGYWGARFFRVKVVLISIDLSTCGYDNSIFSSICSPNNVFMTSLLRRSPLAYMKHKQDPSGAAEQPWA